LFLNLPPSSLLEHRPCMKHGKVPSADFDAVKTSGLLRMNG
jgi:hypothetical protein